MAFEDINHPHLWAIRHKPTNQLLRQFKKGYGHTQLDVVDAPTLERVKRNVTLAPRLFTDEDTAKRALTQWLQGVHRNDWEDGITVSTPSVPRVKEDMEVIPVYLYTDYKDEPNY